MTVELNNNFRFDFFEEIEFTRLNNNSSDYHLLIII